MRSAFALWVVASAAACGPGVSADPDCPRRFSDLMRKTYRSADPVRAVYIFDLSRMDDERRRTLENSGLGGRGVPRTMYSDRLSPAIIASFERSEPRTNGLLLVVPRASFFRVAGGVQPSPAAAIRAGCGLLPGARLRSIALDAT